MHEASTEREERNYVHITSLPSHLRSEIRLHVYSCASYPLNTVIVVETQNGIGERCIESIHSTSGSTNGPALPAERRSNVEIAVN